MDDPSSTGYGAGNPAKKCLHKADDFGPLRRRKPLDIIIFVQVRTWRVVEGPK